MLTLDNRELAIIIWAFILLSFCLSKSKDAIVPIFRQTVITLMHPSVAIVLFTYITSAWIVVYISYCLGFWNFSNLKVTVIWMLFSGLGMLFNFKQSDNAQHLKDWILGQLGVTAYITFFITIKTFSLWTELILQPILVFLILLTAFSKKDKKNEQVSRFLEATLALIGISVLIYFICEAISQPQDFFKLSTLHEFILPIYFSLIFSPLLYTLYALYAYERVFSILTPNVIPSELKKCTEFSAFRAFKFDTVALDMWRHYILIHNCRDTEAIKASISKIKNRRQLEKNPPQINRSQGWCPFIARDILKEHNLQTSYYKDIGGEWFASSNLGIEDDNTVIIKNNISFFLNGDEDAVKKMELKLNVNNPANKHAGEILFKELSFALINRAIDNAMASDISSKLNFQNDQLVSNEIYDVQIKTHIWEKGIKDGYSKSFIIKVKSFDN